MTPRPTLFADFQNADRDGRVRMITAGSLQDLDDIEGGPVDGLPVRLDSGELSVDGVLRFSTEDDIWVVEIDWADVTETG